MSLKINFEIENQTDIWLIVVLFYRRIKLLQKREMRKDIVIELSYKGFSRASDYS